MTGGNPFDMPAMPLLALFLVLFALAGVASLLIPRWLRPEGRTGTASHVDQLAYLSGGPRRFVDAVVTRLYARGAVAIEAKRGLAMRAAPSAGRSAAEIAVLGLTSPARYSAARQQLRGHADKVRDRLIETGLLIDAGTALQLRFWQTLPLIALIVLGVISRPGGSLSAILIALLGLAILRLVVLDRRTHAGLAVIAAARSRHQRLRLAAPRDEADMAVALFGTAALVGSGLSDLHRLSREGGSSSGCGGSGCGSDSGGGCGGGGCGS